MKLRCIESNQINYSEGFEYITQIDSFVNKNGEVIDVIHGVYTWFYFDKKTLTATKRNGDVVAKFKREQ